MSSYRRGTVLGLTIAETFILLTFLLIVALLGLTQQDEPLRSRMNQTWRGYGSVRNESRP